MKKAIWITICVLLFVPAIAVAIAYGAVKYQFKDTFMPGVFINGLYAADYTPAMLNDKLKEDTVYPEFTITDKDGKVYTFSLEEINYNQDYLSQVTDIHNNQSPIDYVKWLTAAEVKFDELQLEPVRSYDKNILHTYLDSVAFLKDNSNPEGKTVEIRYNEGGYYLYDETKNLLSHEKASQAVETALSNGVFEVNLLDEGCYIEVDHTSQMKGALDLWEKLSYYVDTTITYEFGDTQEVVDNAEISKFIAVDENGEFLFDESGSFYLDEKKVKEYVEVLAEKYDTVNKPRSFKATRGGIVTVETGTYGYKLNQKEEVKYLMNVIGQKKQLVRKPEYTQIPFTEVHNTANDIGNTYIEVDLSNQMMYYYVNGRLEIETPVVTGNTSLRRGTPQKVCYVYAKQRNRILRGEDYETFVNYWMPVYGGVGIHDATWRGRFGGTIYKTNGSHGCINTPMKAVSKLYGMVEIGTPVIIFY